MPEPEYTNSGEGVQINNTGPGMSNVNWGGGTQINADRMTIIQASGSPAPDESQRGTDPRADKTRIEFAAGGLLKEACSWIFDDPRFQDWCFSQDSRLLWIRGDAGRGKTMLLAGIADEMERLPNSVVSYLFCQRADGRINHAIAVLKGLIFLLAEREPSLERFQKRSFPIGCENDNNSVNAIPFLSNILEEALRQLDKTVYLVIDALDECDEDGQEKLLTCITHIASRSPRVQSLVSSRDNEKISSQFRMKMGSGPARLEIELNNETISPAVEIFARERLSSIEWLKYDTEVLETALEIMYGKARANFRWVDLAFRTIYIDCQGPGEANQPKLLDILRNAPSQLHHMEAEALVNMGYQQYQKFKDGGNRDYRLLDKANDMCEQAISVADSLQPVHITAITYAYICKAECYREKSHEGFGPREKKRRVNKAKLLLTEAQENAKKAQDSRLLRRIRCDRAVVDARMILVEIKSPSPPLDAIRRKLPDVEAELEAIREGAEDWVGWWLGELQEAKYTILQRWNAIDRAY